MSSHVKMGLLIGAAIIIATAMWLYFSPFQTCVRAYVDTGGERRTAEIVCAHNAR
jgi:hypothetical protein